jgi:hypothetical protein
MFARERREERKTDRLPSLHEPLLEGVEQSAQSGGKRNRSRRGYLCHR